MTTRVLTTEESEGAAAAQIAAGSVPVRPWEYGGGSGQIGPGV